MTDRWSTGDPREDYERDMAHEDSAARRLYESGADVTKWQWCPQLRRMRLRTDQHCATCVGPAAGSWCVRPGS